MSPWLTDNLRVSQVSERMVDRWSRGFRTRPDPTMLLWFGAMIFNLVRLFLILLVVLSLWGFYISIRPAKILTPHTPKNFGRSYEDIVFTTHDGLTLRGWWIPGKTPKTVILLHGYPADKGNILPAVSFLSDDYNLLLFDFRYLGKSEGRYSTIGGKEIHDLLAAIRYLKQRGVEEVGIWGFSMGGAVALMCIGKSPEIKAVVSESSYASLADMAPELFRIPVLRYPLAYLVRLWAKIFLGLSLKDVSPAKAVKGSTVPILLVHSVTDDVIPFSQARVLQSALKENPRAEFWFRSGGAHGNLGPEYEKKVSDFFRRSLG